jgi:hypothetical protein
VTLFERRWERLVRSSREAPERPSPPAPVERDWLSEASRDRSAIVPSWPRWTSPALALALLYALALPALYLSDGITDVFQVSVRDIPRPPGLPTPPVPAPPRLPPLRPMTDRIPALAALFEREVSP